jgi:hypothetical protein
MANLALLDLPTEILQYIFVLSCNLNLPLSSPLIGARLSTNYCFKEICKHYFALPSQASFPHALPRPTASAAGPPAVRSAIRTHPKATAPHGWSLAQTHTFLFAAKFMNWEFFKNHVLEDLMKENLCVCGHYGCEHLKSWIQIAEAAVVPVPASTSAANTTTAATTADPTAAFPNTNIAHHGTLPSGFPSSNPMDARQFRSHPLPFPHLRGTIPLSLLSPPHTAEKTIFLTFLTRTTHMALDRSLPQTGRVVYAARMNAILTGNLPLTHLLNNSRRLVSAPTVTTLVYAVSEGGCDRSIVFDILETGRRWGCTDWKSDEMDAWIQKVKGSRVRGPGSNDRDATSEVMKRKAEWLEIKLREMREAPGYPQRDSGDYDWGDGDRLMMITAAQRRERLSSRSL